MPNMELILNLYLVFTYLNHFYSANCIKFTNCDETKCKEVNQMFLSQANYYRAFHSADPLILDDGLILEALKKSRKLAEGGRLDPLGEKFGENTYRLSRSTQQNNSNTDIIKIWYKEICDYRGEYNNKTSNFTQLVWKDTKKMGCGVYSMEFKDTFITCKFSPRGNIRGLFTQNVLPPVPAITKPTSSPQKITTRDDDDDFSLLWDSHEASSTVSTTDSILSEEDTTDMEGKMNIEDNAITESNVNIKYNTNMKGNTSPVKMGSSMSTTDMEGNIEMVQTSTHDVFSTETNDDRFSTPDKDKVQTCVQILFITTLVITSLALFSLIILTLKHGCWCRV